MKDLAPICLFTYNRLNETQQTIASLLANEESKDSNLFIFSDGGKTEEDQIKVETVRSYLKKVKGFHRINLHYSKTNKGLASSIIGGVSSVLENYDRVIVLEDDLICNTNFLSFMNQALSFYKETEEVQTVTGFSIALDGVNQDVYFQRRPFSWGWATWGKYWDKDLFDKEELRKVLTQDATIIADFKKICGNNMGSMLLDSLDGKNDSWFVRWAFSQYNAKRYSVIPNRSLVHNIGFGSEGTHCKGINPYSSRMEAIEKRTYDLPVFKVPDSTLTKKFLRYFTLQHKLKVRMRLLKTGEGRFLLWDEIKRKVL